MPDARVKSRRPTTWIRWIIAVAAALFVWAHRADLLASASVLAQLRLVPLLVAIALSGVAILNRGGMNRAAHRAVGLTADLPSMTRVSAAAYALNKVVKTGGMGGIALFVRHGETKDRPAGAVTAAYVLVSSCAQIALLVIVLTAIAGAALTGSLSGAWLTGSIVVAIIGTILLTALFFAVRDVEIVRLLHALPYRALRALSTRFGRPGLASPDQAHADRFHAAAASVRQSPRSVLPVLAHAVAAKLLGAGVLAASLVATGANIGFTEALLVYALALVTAIVAILPGGLGAVEASMAAILSTFGIAAPIAIAAVLTFRLLDLWLPLGVGLLASRGLSAASRPSEALVYARR